VSSDKFQVGFDDFQVLEVSIDGAGDRDGGRDGEDGDGMEWEVNSRDIEQIVMEQYEMCKQGCQG
jgi:hypothetical protein